MPEIIFRKLTPHDYKSMVRVWQKAGLPYRPQGRESSAAIMRQLGDDHIKALGAFSDGEMVGVVIGSHDGRKGWINRLAVVPEMQKQGIAQELVSKVEQIFESTGIKMYAALINSDNLASMSLFQKLGYEVKPHIMYFRKLADKEF